MGENSSEYESPLRERYASEAMQRLFMPQRKFSTWRRLWLALAEAQKELGLDISDEQIEQMRAQVEAHDIEAAERQINDLSSLGAWDRVGEVMNELLERHPDAPRANELAQRLRAQRNQAEAEQRSRLMARAQEASNNREWKAALAAATSLIQRYAKSPEAQALRMQLPTLQERSARPRLY